MGYARGTTAGDQGGRRAGPASTFRANLLATVCILAWTATLNAQSATGRALDDASAYLSRSHSTAFGQGTGQRPVFDIPPQSLADALVEFGEQTGLQVSLNPELVRGRTTQGIRGQASPPEALERLLGNSGLSSSITGRTVVVAQAAPDGISGDGEIELRTITVTGERVERSVFETPSSVVVVTGEELEDSPSDNRVEDVLEDIPNVVVLGTSNDAPVIRGQDTAGPLSGGSQFFTGSLPRATIIVDGRPISFNEYVFGTTSVWDVDTMEVFRGPQTTSQGVNSIAGAFHIRTRDPVFRPEMAARAQYGNFDAVNASLMFNTPLVPNELAIRATADFNIRDTYVRYATPGQTILGQANDLKNFTGRVKLLWEPAALEGLSAKLTFSYADTAGPQTENVDQPFRRLQRTTNNDPAVFENQTFALVQDTKYSFSDALIFKNRFQWSDYDIDRLRAIPANGIGGLSGMDIANETILNLNLLDGRLTGVLGLHVREIREDFVFNLRGDTSFNDKKNSLGAFGELTYKVTDKLDVTAGLRYQRDEQRRRGIAFANSPIPFIMGSPQNYQRTFDAILPKFAIGYNVNDELRVGAVVSKGFNPGGVGFSFNTVFTGTPGTPFFNFEDETLWNYELYLRGRFLDGRLTTQANAFYTDFKDHQISTVTLLPNNLFDSVVVNAEDAESYGLEASANFQATDTFRVFGSIGLLKTKIKKFTASTAGLQGNEFRGAPDFTGTAGFDWEFVENLTYGAKVRYNDGYFSDNENTAATKIDAFAVVDMKLTYKPNERVTAFAFVNNLLNDIYPVNAFVSGGGLVAPVGMPREFGVGASIKLP
ncbi:MAG: TonB-dependent receptor [Pseudomonadota bacterium]